MSLIEADYACEAHIKVDNEIGGPGVATSFLFVSWLTIALAAILAVHEFRLAIQRFRVWRERRSPAREKARNSPSSHIGLSVSETTTPALDANSPTNTRPDNLTGDDEATKQRTPGPNTAELPPKLHKLIQLLGHICDIQVVTALAIIVAGVAQWNRISYYHEVLVTQYFQLTLDSFWAARINYMDFYQIEHVHDNLTIPTHSSVSGRGSVTSSSRQHQVRIARISSSYYDDRQPRLQVRRAAVLCACILAAVWHFRLYFRENVGPQHWNEGPSGPCYRYLDRSHPVAALVVRTTGLVVFCFALGVTLLGYPWAGKVHARYEWLRMKGMSWARGRFSNSLRRYDLLRARKIRGLPGSSRTELTWEKQASSHDSPRESSGTERKGRLQLVTEWTLTLGLLAVNSFILLIILLIVQWLAIWTYGDGFYPLLWFCYFCFNVWNTISVISLLILNRPLVDPEEWEWGFGQVLPMVLLLAIVFVTIDVFSRQVLFSHR
ncbi:hypothetical protein V8F20_011777 [Naviculisporaceae sp. PSN 640]